MLFGKHLQHVYNVTTDCDVIKVMAHRRVVRNGGNEKRQSGETGWKRCRVVIVTMCTEQFWNSMCRRSDSAVIDATKR